MPCSRNRRSWYRQVQPSPYNPIRVENDKTPTPSPARLPSRASDVKLRVNQASMALGIQTLHQS